MTGAPMARPVDFVPACVNSGCQNPLISDRHLVAHMIIPTALRDERGAVVSGSIAVLADSFVGHVVADQHGEIRAMVTSTLHIDMLRPLAADATRLTCEAWPAHADAVHGVASGTISHDGVEIARATLGAVLFDLTSEQRARIFGSPPPPVGRREFRSVDDLLTTTIVSRGEGELRVEFRAGAHLSNVSGGVHGGMGALMGQRAIDLALNSVVDVPEAWRLTDLRAVFVRPIAADETMVTCRAHLVHRGRTLVAARAELLDQRGRVAVLVDTTHICASRLS